MVRNDIEISKAQYGQVMLKRWTKKDGYILYFKTRVEGHNDQILAEGKTIVEVLENFKEERRESFLSYFVREDNHSTREYIRDNFYLNSEESEYLNKLPETYGEEDEED